MTRFCKAASWFCNCLAVALLIVGIFAVPEQARADGGKTCADVCASYTVGTPDYNVCMAQCTGLQVHPCGGTVDNDNNCIERPVGENACLQNIEPLCGNKPGCHAWEPASLCPCACRASAGSGSRCGCYSP